MAILKINVRELLPIDASFFQTFVSMQGGFAFFVTLLVGPPLVSRDLRNNALPFYLCRPFSRAEYVAGKMSATSPQTEGIINLIPFSFLADGRARFSRFPNPATRFDPRLTTFFMAEAAGVSEYKVQLGCKFIFQQY